MKILIVEDEAIMEMPLTEFGHEVCAIASTATEAIEHVEFHRPDILILDVRLAHGSSGIEAAREICGTESVRFFSAAIWVIPRARPSSRMNRSII
jgi:DNA-binding response OmpR family regulator